MFKFLLVIVTLAIVFFLYISGVSGHIGTSGSVANGLAVFMSDYTTSTCQKNVLGYDFKFYNFLDNPILKVKLDNKTRVIKKFNNNWEISTDEKSLGIFTVYKEDNLVSGVLGKAAQEICSR